MKTKLEQELYAAAYDLTRFFDDEAYHATVEEEARLATGGNVSALEALSYRMNVLTQRVLVNTTLVP